MTGWRCTACSQPVLLVEARRHYDACAGGDPDEAAADSCVLCDAPADDDGELCDACAEVAP
jgi:hypothetical protein